MAVRIEVEIADDLYEELAEYAEVCDITVAGAVASCVATCLAKRLDAQDVGDGAEERGSV